MIGLLWASIDRLLSALRSRKLCMLSSTSFRMVWYPLPSPLSQFSAHKYERLLIKLIKCRFFFTFKINPFRYKLRGRWTTAAQLRWPRHKSKDCNLKILEKPQTRLITIAPRTAHITRECGRRACNCNVCRGRNACGRELSKLCLTELQKWKNSRYNICSVNISI